MKRNFSIAMVGSFLGVCLLVSAGMAQQPAPQEESNPLLSQEQRLNAVSQQKILMLEARNGEPAAKALLETPKEAEGFVAARETVEDTAKAQVSLKAVYNPKNQRDPMLSPGDYAVLQERERRRLAAIEAERQRKLAEERRRQEEAERLRQLELARLRDPAREVRNKIHIGGIIGQEVFIGSKIYTVGNTILGARIIEVRPDEVVFSYKGHKFVRKVQL